MKVEKLGDLCNLIIGRTPSRNIPEYWRKGHTWVSISDMKEKQISQTKEQITDFAVNKVKPPLVKSGTLLMSFKLSIGKLAFAEHDLYTNEAIVALNIKNESNLYSEYLYYVLKSIPLDGANTAAKGKTLNSKSLEQIKIPLPESYEDQIRIATLLSHVEAQIAARKESLKLLDELVKSVFLKMFGDPVKNEKGWDKSLLVKCCKNPNDIKCGPFGTQLSKREYQKRGIPLWGIPQINSIFKILPTDFLTEGKAIELDDYSIITNDIVMSRKGNVGKCSLYPPHLPKGIMHSDVLRIRLDENLVDPIFVCYQLKISPYVERQIANLSKGAIMAGINVGKLKHISIFTPPFPLQNKFAALVKKIDSLKSQYQQSLSELENLYASLSQKAFKGELDLSKMVLEQKSVQPHSRFKFIEIEDEPKSVNEKDISEAVFYHNEVTAFFPNIKPPSNPEEWKIYKKLPEEFDKIIFSYINTHFSEHSFSFDELMCKLKPAFEFFMMGEDEMYQYVRRYVMTWLESHRPLLSQTFSETERQIELQRQ